MYILTTKIYQPTEVIQVLPLDYLRCDSGSYALDIAEAINQSPTTTKPIFVYETRLFIVKNGKYLSSLFDISFNADKPLRGVAYYYTTTQVAIDIAHKLKANVAATYTHIKGA